MLNILLIVLCHRLKLKNNEFHNISKCINGDAQSMHSIQITWQSDHWIQYFSYYPQPYVTTVMLAWQTACWKMCTYNFIFFEMHVELPLRLIWNIWRNAILHKHYAIHRYRLLKGWNKLIVKNSLIPITIDGTNNRTHRIYAWKRMTLR